MRDINYDSSWIQTAIANSMGLPDDASESQIDRALYKGTNCGAYVKFDHLGVLVGSIVEGSDAEFLDRLDLSGLDDLDQDESEKQLVDRFWKLVQWVEDSCEEEWNFVHNNS